MKITKLTFATAVLSGFLSTQALADVKIGFTGPLSGPAALIGEDQYDGLMLAIDRLNGKLGGEPATVIKEDDQLKPEVGLQIMRKLISKDNVDVLVGLGYTNVLMATMPVITESGKVAIATNSGPRALSGAGCQPRFFSVAHQNDGPSEYMGIYANEKHYKRVFLMAPNYQAGKEMMEGFKRYYKGEIAGEIYTPLTQMDFSAEISEIQFSKADAMFFFMTGGSGINLVKQMRQSGVLAKVPTMSVFSIDATTLPALKALADGAVTGTKWSATLDIPANKEFVAAFEAKYKRPASMYAAAGYDAGNLLNVAIKKVNGNLSNQEAFAKAVKEAGSEFKSVRGYFAFNNNHMPIQNYYAFKVVADGDDVHMQQIGTPLKAHQDIYHTECPLK